MDSNHRLIITYGNYYKARQLSPAERLPVKQHVPGAKPGRAASKDIAVIRYFSAGLIWNLTLLLMSCGAVGQANGPSSRSAEFNSRAGYSPFINEWKPLTRIQHFNYHRHLLDLFRHGDMWHKRQTVYKEAKQSAYYFNVRYNTWQQKNENLQQQT